MKARCYRPGFYLISRAEREKRISEALTTIRLSDISDGMVRN